MSQTSSMRLEYRNGMFEIVHGTLSSWTFDGPLVAYVNVPVEAQSLAMVESKIHDIAAVEVSTEDSFLAFGNLARNNPTAKVQLQVAFDDRAYLLPCELDATDSILRFRIVWPS